jgi:hypothetical protein
MTINIFKQIPVALATVLFASAYAGMDMDTRVTQLEQQLAQVRTENAMGTYGSKVGSAQPDVVGGNDFFVELNVTYEQTRFGGSEYCYSDADNSSATPIDGTLRDVKPKWQFGVEAAVGIITGLDDWEVLAQYSYLGASGSSSIGAGLNGVIVPLRADQNLTLPAGVLGAAFTRCTQAQASSSWQYNVLSAEFAKAFFLSRTLSLRPYGGLSTTWMELKEKVSYSGGAQLGNNSVYSKDVNQYWGLGPIFGLGSKLHLGAGFSFYSDMATTFFYGNVDVTHKEYYSNAPTVGVISLNGDLHRFVPQLEAGLGLTYETYLNDNKDHLEVSLGYDLTYIFRLNQMLSSQDGIISRYSEDVTMEGVKLSLRWDF